MYFFLYKGKQIYFAGECTTYKYMGTVHGAYISGKKTNSSDLNFQIWTKWIYIALKFLTNNNLRSRCGSKNDQSN